MMMRSLEPTHRTNPTQLKSTKHQSQMQANSSAWAATLVLGWTLFWASGASCWSSTHLDEGYLADTLRYREELRNSDGDGFLLCLIRQRSFSRSGGDGHGCSPCLSNSLHVIPRAILWVHLVGIQFLEKQFFFVTNSSWNVSLVGFLFVGKSFG